MCVLIFSTALSEIFLILRRIQQDSIMTVHWSSCKVPVIPIKFQWNLNYNDRFSKNTQIPNFVKIRPVEAEFFHTDERADSRHDEADHLLCSFARTLETDDALWKSKFACMDMTQCGLAVEEVYLYCIGITVASWRRYKKEEAVLKFSHVNNRIPFVLNL